MSWRTPHGLIAVASRHPASRRSLSTLHRGPGSFSLAIGPSASKRLVVERARDAVGSATRARAASGSDESRPGDAAVILASRSLSTWLGDEEFVSALLQASRPEGSGRQSPEISVLSAAVDGIPWPDEPHGVQDGLSVLHGSLASMLPGLWSNASGSPAGGSVVQPSITIPFPRFETALTGPEVTVPLSNTVFDNGRPFTMFASRWQRQPGSQLKLTQSAEKERQLVVPTFSGDASTGISAPLLPITLPRKIVAGLGNIVRQVDIDGKPASASKELEAVIPELLHARSSHSSSESTTPGPMGVWAVVVPESVAKRGGLPQLREKSDGGGGGALLSEWEAAMGASQTIARLLASGCRLQRILSGGGGWGLKQGLLSLDPQVRYSMPDEEDVERFIRSFKGETSSDDIITPGSHIQFFVEPMQPRQMCSTVGRPGRPVLDSPEVVVGTCARAEGQEVSSVEDGVQIATGYFGALSSQGMFVASSPDAAGSHGTPLEISMKIDAPNFRVKVPGKPCHERVDTDV